MPGHRVGAQVGGGGTAGMSHRGYRPPPPSNASLPIPLTLLSQARIPLATLQLDTVRTTTVWSTASAEHLLLGGTWMGLWQVAAIPLHSGFPMTTDAVPLAQALGG